MDIFFTSDQHFSHANIIKYCNRPFKDTDHMNEELVRRHNTIVSPTDIVFHLGDFSMSRQGVEKYLPRLNGIHHLIAGNHDHCHPVHAKKAEKLARMEEFYRQCGFETISLEDLIFVTPTFAAIVGTLRDEVHTPSRLVGETVKMHHMPYQGDHTEAGERYTKWRPADEGNWLLHGHVHDKWKQRGKMINVGVDVWDFTPVNIEQIEELIRKGPVP